MLSKNIKLLREEARLSKQELADKVNVSVDELITYEKAKAIPSKDLLEKMCVYLRISYEDIIERDLVNERNEAGKRMHQGANIKTYSWYYRTPQELIYYITYIILVGLGYYLLTLFTNYLYAYIIIGGIAGVYISTFIIRKKHLRFNVYYIFFIPIILSIIIIMGNILMIPFIFHAIYVLLIKHGRK